MNTQTFDTKNIGESFKHHNPEMEMINVLGANASLLDDKYSKLRVAIVGTRNATPAGLNDTRKIAQEVCKAGGIVVSGMAHGIDGAAHQGAIDTTGSTIAVLGSGVDVIYPMRHKKIYEHILKTGCVVSQFANGTRALPWHFPVRNKIIVSLCDILVVTEGTLKGGARISVDLALEMGKTVLALPGPRRSYASELCNSIIKDGAQVITDPSDVVKEFGIDLEPTGWELSPQSKVDPISNIHKNILKLKPDYTNSLNSRKSKQS